ALLAAEPDADGDQGGGALVDVVRRSYDLLRPEQQRLLPALSVFAGPFTVADAGAVGGRGGPSLARAIRGLVDSSWLLVDRGEPNRFSMLATMRLFAAARTPSISRRWPPAASTAWPGPTPPRGPAGSRAPSPTWMWRCNGRRAAISISACG